jgi:hypothetical protein
LPPSPPAEKATTCQDQAGQSGAGDGAGDDKPRPELPGAARHDAGDFVGQAVMNLHEQIADIQDRRYRVESYAADAASTQQGFTIIRLSADDPLSDLATCQDQVALAADANGTPKGGLPV